MVILCDVYILTIKVVLFTEGQGLKADLINDDNQLISSALCSTNIFLSERFTIQEIWWTPF